MAKTLYESKDNVKLSSVPSGAVLKTEDLTKSFFERPLVKEIYSELEIRYKPQLRYKEFNKLILLLVADFISIKDFGKLFLEIKQNGVYHQKCPFDVRSKLITMNRDYMLITLDGWTWRLADALQPRFLERIIKEYSMLTGFLVGDILKKIRDSHKVDYKVDYKHEYKRLLGLGKRELGTVD